MRCVRSVLKILGGLLRNNDEASDVSATGAPEGVEVTFENGKRVVRRSITTSDGPAFVVTDFPDAVDHPYKQLGPDESIVLHEGLFNFAPGDGEREVEGFARLEWRPVPRIDAFGKYTNPSSPEDDLASMADFGSTGWTVIPWIEFRGGQTFPNIPTSQSSPSEPTATPQHGTAHAELREQSFEPDVKIDCVTFAICNGWEALDIKRVSNPDAPWEYYSARFTANINGDYRIIVDAVEGLRQLLRDLGRRGGVAFTHFARIERIDESEFTLSDCESLLNSMRLAICIATGRRIDVALPVGHTANRMTSATWNLPRVDDYRTAHTLLDPTTASSQTAELIAKCATYCEDSKRKEVLHHALTYYLGSNRGSNLQLACAQVVSGLQLLSFFRLVTEGSSSRSHWDGLNTHDQIRALLNECNIPTAITPNSGELARAGAQLANPTNDALEILIKMRNVVIHPSRDTTDKRTFYQWYEAWSAARELLLLAILNTIDYSGPYRSILESNTWMGTLNNLPWQSPRP